MVIVCKGGTNCCFCPAVCMRSVAEQLAVSGTCKQIVFGIYCYLKASLRVQVVAYGISINLVEVTWKSKIKAQFPNPNEYSSFMGDFSSATGAVTFLMMLLSRTIFKRYGWGVAALITPTVLLITGMPPLPSLLL